MSMNRQKIPNIFLIGGCQRSGTTLFQTVLENALPSCTQLPEAHIACDLFESYKKRVTELHKSTDFFESEMSLNKFYRSFFEKFLKQILTIHTGKENIVLKDPNFSKVLPAIETIAPKVHMFLMVRDPRDIVASFIQIGNREKPTGADTKYTRRDVLWIIGKIRASYEPYCSKRDSLKRVIVVRYEDLCQQPTGIVRSLLEPLAVPYKLDLDKLSWTEDEKRHSNESWLTDLEGGSPTEAHGGHYSEVLTNKEVSSVNDRCADLLFQLGYKASGSTPFLWRNIVPNFYKLISSLK